MSTDIRWRREPPDCEGWWLKYKALEGMELRLVFELHGHLHPRLFVNPKTKHWFWLGPIPKPPEEVTHECS